MARRPSRPQAVRRRPDPARDLPRLLRVVADVPGEARRIDAVGHELRPDADVLRQGRVCDDDDVVELRTRDWYAATRRALVRLERGAVAEAVAVGPHGKADRRLGLAGR